MFFSVLCTAISITAVVGYPEFKSKIPNGISVNDPCGRGEWHGVGHYLMGGTGQLNPFGEDFAAGGFVWTYELCKKDSDFDGKTNGEELGDPFCHFTSLKRRNLGRARSHPGICEPIGSPNCEWQRFSCPNVSV
ncbi:unnamed protein product [Lymnaea stagnalis]|uniref:Temptin Cys/Cys disulfide domain-containing protein n=1 Tax=Lymnaea stagnalis TaxID=6523 RepID=A0AAV2HKY2_LYMST